MEPLSRLLFRFVDSYQGNIFSLWGTSFIKIILSGMWKRNCMKTTGSKQHIMVASGGLPRRSWPGLLNLWASATGPQFYQEGQVNNFYLISFKKYLTNIFILAALGLCCCLQAFSSCSK